MDDVDLVDELGGNQGVLVRRKIQEGEEDRVGVVGEVGEYCGDL